MRIINFRKTNFGSFLGLGVQNRHFGTFQALRYGSGIAPGGFWYQKLHFLDIQALRYGTGVAPGGFLGSKIGLPWARGPKGP